jgi:ATP/maltotriose-dependent transcriptional regulator MalT
MEDRVSEAYAVMSKLKIERAVVAGDASGSHVAIRFAHQYPDRVSALVLLRGTLSLSEKWNNFASLAARDWELFLGLTDRDSGLEDRAKVEHLQASMTRDDLLRHAETIATSDVSELLPQLSTPTLILHVRDQVERWHTEQAAAEMASLIPNARLAMVGGPHVWGDPDAAVAAIQQFLASVPSTSGDDERASGEISDHLSQRELEVLRLVAAGNSNQQIADELVISLNTARKHVANILDKTGTANRTEAAGYARDNGLA